LPSRTVFSPNIIALCKNLHPCDTVSLPLFPPSARRSFRYSLICFDGFPIVPSASVRVFDFFFFDGEVNSERLSRAFRSPEFLACPPPFFFFYSRPWARSNLCLFRPQDFFTPTDGVFQFYLFPPSGHFPMMGLGFTNLSPSLSLSTCVCPPLRTARTPGFPPKILRGFPHTICSRFRTDTREVSLLWIPLPQVPESSRLLASFAFGDSSRVVLVRCLGLFTFLTSETSS